MNIAIIFAGGTGQRCETGTNIPKQFIEVLGKPIIIHTLDIFQNHPEIDKIYIAIHPDYKSYMEELVQIHELTKVKGIVNGGASGQESIYNALLLAKEENFPDDIVLIHDGVRPIVDNSVISKNIEYVKKYGSAITCTNCHETVLISTDGITPVFVPFRHNTYTAQAPQSFRLSEILDAHYALHQRPEPYENMIDSCTIFDYLGRKLFMVQGNRGNIKITTKEDLHILKALIEYRRKEQKAYIIGRTTNELEKCNY